MRDIDITNEDQIPDILDWALAGDKSLAICGNNSKAALGRPMQVDGQINLGGLSGIQLHEPAELVMQAKAGTSLELVKSTLRDAGQELAFSPPDYGPLLGGAAGQSTIGGVFNCNLSGSKRIKVGAARDHLLGAKGFSGRGEAFQTGSRVMKNVTGYDLCKLITGSHGTLALCTSLTFKVLPRPEKIRTVLVFGLAPTDAVAAMRDALSSVHDVSATAYLPADIAAGCGIDHVTGPGASVTALRIEGPAPSAEFRCAALREALKNLGAQEELHAHNSVALWNFISDVTPFVADQTTSVWKVSIPPASVPAYLEKVSAAIPGLQYYLDWAGGLVWLSVPAGFENAGADILRANLEGGGYATLIRGTAEIRSTVSPFQPQNAVMAKISERVRNGFDPHRIFNPGRMYPVEA